MTFLKRPNPPPPQLYQRYNGESIVSAEYGVDYVLEVCLCLLDVKAKISFCYKRKHYAVG